MAKSELIARADTVRRVRFAVHDGLCLEGRTWGKYCHCMCARCWDGHTRVSQRDDVNGNVVLSAKSAIGKCICEHCPCRDETARALRKVRK